MDRRFRPRPNERKGNGQDHYASDCCVGDGCSCFVTITQHSGYDLTNGKERCGDEDKHSRGMHRAHAWPYNDQRGKKSYANRCPAADANLFFQHQRAKQGDNKGSNETHGHSIGERNIGHRKDKQSSGARCHDTAGDLQFFVP